MPHPDADDLALLALFTSDGGATQGADESVAQHVSDCARCRLEVAALTRTVALARFEDVAELPPPPNRVWDAIAAELDLTPAPPVSRPVDLRSTVSRSVPPAAIRSVSLPTNGHVPLAIPESAPNRTRWRRFALPVAAALVGALVGGVVVWGLRSSGSPTTPAPAVAASAVLVPVPGGPGKDPEKGQAQLLQTPGGPQLRVVSSDLPGIAGSYEVWLLGTDGKMVSLGVLSQGAGTFTVPAGISTSQYGTVDISDEPADGNPAHSKVSVLRGKLS